MNERVTLVCTFDNKGLQKIENYINKLGEKVCKVPFGKNVDNREEVDTLPYHFTLMYWDIEREDQVMLELSKQQFPQLKIVVNSVEIMKASEDSYELFFNIDQNQQLKDLQESIYNKLPSNIYTMGRRNFHISIHADKDYNKVIKMKEKLMDSFVPFELNVESYKLYKIYPAVLVFSVVKNNF